MKSDLLTLAEVKQKVLDLLSRRDYSRHELFSKLKEKANLEELNRVLDDMAERGWQSDQRFANNFLNSRSSKYGPLRLQQELRNKGVHSDLSSQAFDELEVNFKQQAREIFERKFPDFDATDMKQKAKAYRFLAQRGFSAEQVQYALRAQLDND